MATIDDVIDTDDFEPLEIESIDDEERNGLLQNTEVQAAPHSSQSCGMKELFISLISMAAISFILAVVITSKKDSTATDPSEEISLYPKALLQNVYHKVDFENKKHIIPPYWKDAELKTFQEGALPHLGPCYLPKEEQDWLSLVEKNEQIRGKHNIKYRDGIKKRRDDSDNAKDLSGLCRPGFIIIGAGKCGTSSLYHYLVGHDRVLPAKNKQIHYFKYWKSYPMKWYLSNFPPAETFLSNGTLMTGEASPGYLPYPDVAHIIGTWMQSHAGNGAMQPLVSPKIITIMRNPLERSWSSYNYNYRVPLLQKLRKKDSKAEAKYSSDEWYEKNKIFSFDELVKAELKLLKACLAPGGNAERSSSKRYSTKEWAAPIFERRQAKGLPGMISLDESCYGKRVSNAVPRRQWQELVEDQPHKEIDVENLHLVQSLVGRSIYVLPLEWWYALYPMKDLHVVCSEDLRYRASRTMSNVSDFLGLPSFDFTNITNAGIYNSGAHTGYDKITEWDKTVYVPDNIPISDELRKEYMDFLKPYNERLFQMTGQNCDWFSSIIQFGYIPDGFTKESYAKFKAEEAKKKQKKNLGIMGPKGFQSRSFQSFQQALERGEASHLMPVFNAKQKVKKGELKVEDIPYMQRGGDWDNSDVKGAKKTKWLDSDKQYRKGGFKREQSISIFGYGNGLDWTGERSRKGPQPVNPALDKKYKPPNIKDIRKNTENENQPKKKGLFGLF